MAKHSSSKGESVVIVAMILALLTGSLAVAEGMRVTLENDMIQPVSISCHSTEGDLGAQLVSSGGRYIFDVPGKFVSGKRYACTFVAAGKPTTAFDVFVGWGGIKNSPCGCLGDDCLWLITANGFSCNFGKWSRNWGN